MVLQRWAPIYGYRRTSDVLDRFWKGFASASTPNGDGRFRVPLDVVQDGDNVVVRASLPGVSPDDISVDIEDGVLTISSDAASENGKGGAYLLRERRSGNYHRSIRLPDTVDANGGESSYELGVVTVTFPKVEAKKARRIEVKAR